MPKLFLGFSLSIVPVFGEDAMNSTHICTLHLDIEHLYESILIVIALYLPPIPIYISVGLVLLPRLLFSKCGSILDQSSLSA